MKTKKHYLDLIKKVTKEIASMKKSNKKYNHEIPVYSNALLRRSYYKKQLRKIELYKKINKLPQYNYDA